MVRVESPQSDPLRSLAAGATGGKRLRVATRSGQDHLKQGQRVCCRSLDDSRLDQLLQPLLQDAVASDLEEDRSLCHPLGAPQVQAVASEDQGGTRLV